MIAWDEYLEKLISVPDVMDEISLSYDGGLGIAETIDPQPECRSFPQPEIACDQVKAFTQRKQSVEKINILGKFCG